jgi:hypothetical protein
MAGGILVRGKSSRETSSKLMERVVANLGNKASPRRGDWLIGSAWPRVSAAGDVAG